MKKPSFCFVVCCLAMAMASCASTIRPVNYDPSLGFDTQAKLVVNGPYSITKIDDTTYGNFITGGVDAYKIIFLSPGKHDFRAMCFADGGAIYGLGISYDFLPGHLYELSGPLYVRFSASSNNIDLTITDQTDSEDQKIQQRWNEQLEQVKQQL